MATSGERPRPAPPASGGDETLDVVRRLIEEAAVAPARAPEPAPAPEPRPVPAPAPRPVSAPAPRPVPVQPVSASPRTVPVERPVAAAPVSSPEPLQTPQASRWRAFTAHASGHVRRFLKRPDAPRRLALALLVLAAIFAPGKLAFLAILAVLMAGVGYVSLGPDRVHELIADWHDRLAQRDPQRAEAIRLRAARVSRAAMALADRLPERWTSGLYLPDFEPAAEMPEKMKHDPFDRLAAELRAGEGGAQG